MWLLAADAPASQDSHTAIILGVIALLTGVLVAVVGGIFSLLSARASRSSLPPLLDDVPLHERVAVLERRADDADDRDETQDRRLDQHERVLDIDNPDWRHRT